MALAAIQRLPWYERHAGLALAGPCAAAVLALLAYIHLPPPPVREPVAMTVLYDLLPEAPAAPALPIALRSIEPAPPLPLEDVRATRDGSTEDGTDVEDVQIAMAGDEGGDETDLPPIAATIGTWVPDAAAAAEIGRIRHGEQMRSQALESRATSIKKAIIGHQVKSAAADFKINSDGGANGAVRLLDLEGFPESQVREVLGRYGVTFERRMMKPADGRSYLNAAVTEEGNYTNSGKAGMYDVMVLSPKAISMMAALEVQELGRRGFDPKTSRVRKIVFGIVRNEAGGLGLGVKQMEVEEI